MNQEKYTCNIGYIIGEKIRSYEVNNIDSVDIFTDDQHNRISVEAYLNQHYPVRAITNLVGDNNVVKLAPRNELAFVHFIKEQ